jgi:iron complex outermembrane receptor protein
MGAGDTMIDPTPLLLVLAAAFTPADSLARPRADSVLVLPEVRVDRERVPSAARRRLPTASITELRAHDSARAVETLPDLLVQAPGVHVQQYGGLGAFSTVSLRGAPAGQVAVLLDGVPLASPGHSVTNLADLPLDAVESVEVYRGLSPLTLGVAAPGGTINLVTAAAHSHLDVRLAGGSFDTWEGRAGGGITRGAWSGTLRLGQQRSQGDFPFHDDNATPFNPHDDEVVRRVNNAFRATTGAGAIAWTPRTGTVVSLHHDQFDKQQGVPGLGANPALDTHLSLTRGVTRLLASRDGGRAVPDVRMRLSALRELTRFEDPSGELGRGRHDSSDRTEGDEAHAELAWSRLPAAFALLASGERRQDRATLSDDADLWTDPPESRRDATAATLGLQWRPWSGRLTLHAAQRTEWLTDALHATGPGAASTGALRRTLRSPQAGAALEAPLGLTVRANWSRGARAPDFTELFGDQGSVIGNPALLPEHNETWDAGLAWRSPVARRVRAAASWARFESHPSDLILYVRNAPSTVKATNVSSAVITGHEWALDASGPGGVSAALALTTQHAIDIGPVVYWNGRTLPQHPLQEGYARIGWRHAAWEAAADAQWMGTTYLDRYNRQRLDGRTLLGARLAAPVPRTGARVILEGRNLGDETATDVSGFPLPGRSLFVACEARFGGRETTR